MNSKLLQAIQEVLEETKELPPKKRVRTEAQKARRRELWHQNKETNNAKQKERYAKKNQDRVRKQAVAGSINHGTIHCYTKHKCRCEPCRKSASEAYKRQKEARYAKYKASNYEGVNHGTIHGYNQAGCRCKECLQAVMATRKK